VTRFRRLLLWLRHGEEIECLLRDFALAEDARLSRGESACYMQWLRRVQRVDELIGL
jgi:hypothetical protein